MAKSSSTGGTSSGGGETKAFRAQLVKFLDGKEAHGDFDSAVAGIPADKRAIRPDGLPYSAWEIVEHLRIAQNDILDFCVNPDYKEKKWPDDYWPKDKSPTDAQWIASIKAFRDDVAALKKLALDESIDLNEKIPHGDGQTYLREILLIIDHNPYHIGQLVAVRRLLGIWDSK